MVATVSVMPVFAFPVMFVTAAMVIILVAAPVTEFFFRVIPLNGYFLAVLTVPIDQPPPLARSNLGRNLKYKTNEGTGRAHYHFTRLGNDGHWKVSDSF
jgi:hypothetical protein